MLEFKTMKTLKANIEILEVIKNYNYKIKKGASKHLLHTNLQTIELTEYIITYPTTLTILECKIDGISTKLFLLKNIIKNIHYQKLSKFKRN